MSPDDSQPLTPPQNGTTVSIVITGATGQLGRLVVEQLMAAGTPPGQIVATGRDTEKLTALETEMSEHLGYVAPSVLGSGAAGFVRRGLASTSSMCISAQVLRPRII